MMRRVLAGGFVLTVLAAPAATADESSPFDGNPATTERILVSDPTLAAVEISRLRFPSGDAAHAVLSRDTVFADSLAGAPLTNRAPLLLTATASLTPVTRDELNRVLPLGRTVYLLGGQAAIGENVERELTKARYQVTRLAGGTRVETAVAVAAEVRRLNPSVDQAALARADAPPENPTAAWADSVTGGAWAAAAGVPIFITPSDSLHPAVRDALGQPTRTVLLGGRSALSEAVEASVPRPFRVAGASRTATAVAIARNLWVTTAGPYLVAPGFKADGWAYGLPAAGLAADVGAPLLLADHAQASQSSLSIARSCRAPSVETALVGDESVLSNVVVAEFDGVDASYCPPPAGRGTFATGQRRVGVDISPGTYRSAPTDYCYWERLRGFSGSFEDIVANGLTSGPTIVTIDPSDAGFDSSRECGGWSADLSPTTASPVQPFGDGIYVIGSDLAPGTWRTPNAPEGCYWERLAGFSGELEDLIANDYVDSAGQQIVEIEHGDRGFRSNNCGTWRKIA